MKRNKSKAADYGRRLGLSERHIDRMLSRGDVLLGSAHYPTLSGLAERIALHLRSAILEELVKLRIRTLIVGLAPARAKNCSWCGGRATHNIEKEIDLCPRCVRIAAAMIAASEDKATAKRGNIL